MLKLPDRISIARLLSEELWLVIFEYVLGSCETSATNPSPPSLPGREPILPLLLVCRQWQRMSEPLMYRHVRIWNSASLRSLDRSISDLSKARGMDIWSWVRTIFTNRQSSDEMITILTRTLNLTELDINIFVSSELLVTLRQCCPSLLSLKVRVDPESRETMAQVGLFEHVKHLSIVTCRLASDWNQPMDPLTDVPSWNLPAVTRFCWYDQGSKWAHEASFMSRCRFPHLTHLDIRLMNPYAVVEGMPHIGRLLDAHRNIISLRILMRGEHHLSVIPFVRARTLQIRCGRRCPLWAVAPLLRPEVKTMELEFRYCDWARVNDRLMSSLWELLTQFSAEDDSAPTLEKIHLRSAASDDDDDDDLEPATDEEFLSTLRSHVLSLKARGIRVFVDDGEIQVCV